MAGPNDHQAVLLDEALQALDIRADGIYLDATFGRGGHSGAILQALGETGRLLALDQDPQAIAWGKERFAAEPRIEFEHCNFSQVKRVISERGLNGRINGVLMDLGVSSPQLDDAGRGFSFQRSGPLDMRMDTTRGESAAQWLSRVGIDELADVLRRLGEERFSRRIARAIVDSREQDPLAETGQLAKLISEAVPTRERHKHPATRSFQAIRMHINRELESVEEGLEAAANVLEIGGRLAVISFHSLEDRLVKRFMRSKSSRPRLPAGLPVMDNGEQPPFRLAGKPRTPGEAELERNPRARSARLRVLERVR